MNFPLFAYQHPNIAAFAVAFTIGSSGAFLIALINTIFKDMLVAMVDFIFNSIFKHKAVYDSYASLVLSLYLNKHAKAFGMSSETYDADRRHIKSEGRERVIFTRRVNRSYRLFIYKGIPILFSPTKHDGEGNTVSHGAFRFLVGTVNWDKLLIDAAAYYDEQYVKREPGKNFRVIRHVGSSRIAEASKASNPFDDQTLPDPDDMLESNVVPINYTPDEVEVERPACYMQNMALSPDMEKIVKDVRFWLRHREWYVDRDITWKRGYMLYGPAGNGKTSLVRAIAEDLDLVVHVFDLSSMSNDEFLNAFADSRDDIPRIVLLEDFDTVFEKRENICEASDLTFDTILNAIDGIQEETGLLLFVTTNHPEHIDEALGVVDANGMSTRPGRIDKCALIGPPDWNGRFKIALRILRDIPLAEEVATLGENDSGAQITERAISRALQELWGDGD